MSEHTPGPWMAELCPNPATPHFHVASHYKMRLDGSDHEFLCEIAKAANAHLIAAAPDLLAALESAHVSLYEHDLCPCAAAFTGFKCEVELAIAKAKEGAA